MKEYASVKSGENEIDFDLMGGNSKKGGIDLTKKGQMKPAEEAMTMDPRGSIDHSQVREAK